jgi:hypothetical protein
VASSATTECHSKHLAHVDMAAYATMEERAKALKLSQGQDSPLLTAMLATPHLLAGTATGPI